MNRFFLDANVIFTAAHNPQGKAALLFELVGSGHEVFLDSHALIWYLSRPELLSS